MMLSFDDLFEGECHALIMQYRWGAWHLLDAEEAFDRWLDLSGMDDGTDWWTD
jgi:hypothetical protein